MGSRFLGTQAFEAFPDQVSAARRWFGERLGRTHPAYDDSVLLLSEAFSNGVQHSKGDKIEVTVYLEDECVRVEVVDGGGDTVPEKVNDPFAENGRGVAIIHALASGWGFEDEDDRLLVWFTVAIPPRTVAR
jgi:anti-sigma regulatory factor (Ser/Thr protein kinase)